MRGQVYSRERVVSPVRTQEKLRARESDELLVDLVAFRLQGSPEPRTGYGQDAQICIGGVWAPSGGHKGKLA